ncbi:MAG: NUDIX hydrolase [Halobacteriaceae archaeon]
MNELAWETVAREVAYSCPGFDVVHEDVRLPDGTETDYDYLSEPPAVVVLPFLGDGGPGDDVVTIAEWRQAVGRVNHGLPAGGVEPADATLAAAAHRELAEETGHEADAVDHLLSVEPANGIADSVHHYFVARDCAPTATQRLDSDESIRVETTPYTDLRDAVLADEVRDGRAATAVLRFECGRA